MPPSEPAGAGSDTNGTAGLFAGFEGYRTPTDEDYRKLLENGLVVVDANVLLNLYRYDDQARDALVGVLRALGDRLWVPHQVLVEFWRNRESVLRDPRDVQKTVKELGDLRDRALRAFRTWANRVSLPEEQAAGLSRPLAEAFASLANNVNASDMEDAATFARDTRADAVLQDLEPVLDRRCGAALAEDQHRAAVQEGMRRVDSRLPPGYMDKKKGDEIAAGDFLVWEHTLLEAARRGVDVLFVTGDVKEDWWREESGERRGARLELVQEMRDRAGVRLFMLRPTSLLEHARRHLGVEVRPESVQEAERVEQFLTSTEDLITGGWDTQSVGHLLQSLDAQAPVQAATVRLAAQQGGFASREQVYELGQYHDERSLRGFTRPVNRIVQEMRAQGQLPDGALDVLTTRYDGGVVATGFDVPREVVPLLAPQPSESVVLAYLAHRFDADADVSRVDFDDLRKDCRLPRATLEVALRNLQDRRCIVGVTVAELNYPVIVTGITERGRSELTAGPGSLSRYFDLNNPLG